MSTSREKQLETYREFLKIPSISAKHMGITEAASYLKDLLQNKGVESRVMNTKGHPVVYGEYNIGADRTLLVYNHYDVQPVDPESEWNQDPFSAEVKDGRVYARGASDNKGTLISRIFGIEDAIGNNDLKVNLKFLYEGEEEIGSPNLHDYIKENRDLLKADAVIMEGSQVGDEGRPVVTLGVKGLLYIELLEETGGTDLHSSMAAIAQNPVWNLVSALNAIYNGEKVMIPGFYDDIRDLSGVEDKILEEYPFSEEDTLKFTAQKSLRFTGDRKLVRELFASPTCNIDGIISGYNGEGTKTVTPRKASAKLDFRLVPDQDPVKIYDSLKAHLREKGFKGEVREYGLEFPVRTPPDTNLAKAMIESAQETFGKKPIIMTNSPGTQPMALFTRELNIGEALSAIGPGDKNSRAHAPNESVSVENFYKAIEHTAKFLKIFR